jgi:hypothetical protein
VSAEEVNKVNEHSIFSLEWQQTMAANEISVISVFSVRNFETHPAMQTKSRQDSSRRHILNFSFLILHLKPVTGFQSPP